MRIAVAFLVALIFAQVPTSAGVYRGTNAPGAYTDVPFVQVPSATNLSLVISNSAGGVTMMLLDYGGAPSATSFAFRAAATGRVDGLHLERPECRATNYVLRVLNVSPSVTNVFTLTLSTNVPDVRSSNRPACKAQSFLASGALTNRQWHYFRVEIPSNSPGWRLVLNAPGPAVPDLYLAREALPATNAYFKSVAGATNGTMILTEAEATPGTYFLGIYQPAGSGSYELLSETGYLTVLTWDPGATHLGTDVFTNRSAAGGLHYFKIVAQNTAVGAWRSALNVGSGEAHLYLRQGALPTTASYHSKSELVGSDGFVLQASQYSAGQEWYLLVAATPSSTWNLVTGEAYVHDLGSLATNGASGSGPVSMGAEGMRFFKTTAPAETRAWQLGLGGATNAVLVKKSTVPHPISYDLKQDRKMLVVPGYLGGTYNGYYFVSVADRPGTTINLDSRQLPVEDLAPAAATNVSVSGSGYRAWRVSVPVDQSVWQVSLATGSGNPDVAVRRDYVPNEWNNDAYSEVAGAANDSVALVQPTLGDGTYFITVYHDAACAFSLSNGPPVVTDIDFTSSSTNDDPQRAGWRYYRIADLDAQLGQLGWELFLHDHVPGSEIVLRRNSAPGRWRYRSSGSNYVASGHLDYIGTNFLQRPGHQADFWYVGVYMPTQALGSFVLHARPLTAEPVSFDGGSTGIVGQTAGKWRYFRVDVPTNALGWDIRIRAVAAGDPQLVVRRDLLPVSLKTAGGPLLYWTFPQLVTNWPSGNQWAPQYDWSERRLDATGTANEAGRILAIGMGNPLEAGTYYVGVLNSTNVGAGAVDLSYTLVSRGIGNGLALPVVDLPFAGGTAAATSVPPREAAYYRVVIASNTPNWQARLQTTLGESLLKIQRGSIPCSVNNHYNRPDGHPYGDGGERMQKAGNEQWVLLPEYASNTVAVRAGTYYLAVVSEGQNATNTTRIGTGTSSWMLESFGPLMVTNLGTLSTADLVQVDALEGGAVKAYQFTVPPGTLSMETRLENRVGNPHLRLVAGTNLPAMAYRVSSHEHDYYGNYGGLDGGQRGFTVITTANPTAGVYSVIVTASDVNESDSVTDTGVFVDASYTLRVAAVVPTPLVFDGGSNVVSGQPPGSTRYFRVDVPTNALAWDIRLQDVTAGNPRLVVRRDQLPAGAATTWPWVTLPVSNGLPIGATNWPSGHQCAAGPDWTGRRYDETGTNDQYGQILVLAMGNPLEAGTYYVGVLGGTNSGTNAMSYTVRSRGIGDGLTLPVVDLPFAGGTATATNVAPREAAYYRVVIPADTPSWQARLQPALGEALLKVQWRVVPGTADDYANGPGGSPYDGGGEKMQKQGPEQWVLLPEQTGAVAGIRAGTYFLAVVSEGHNATNSARIGTGASAWTLESFGTLAVTNLGTASVTDLVQADALEGGAVRAYAFTVPPGTLSVETRLENRVGNPHLRLIAGTNLPALAYTTISKSYLRYHDYYGNHGAVTGGQRSFTAITTANPTAGEYRVIITASDTNESDLVTDTGVFADASYTLRVTAVVPTPLPFDGGSNVVTDQPPGRWRFFRVDVPTHALGWDIRVKSVTSGDPHLVVCRDQLPTALTTTAPWVAAPVSNVYPIVASNWPSGNHWAANLDWTERNYNATGTDNENGRILAAGLGNPLEAGLYYIGVLNGTNTGVGTNAMSYTVLSRGIGDGLALPVVDIPFAGGSASATSVVPREAAYYRVVIPSNTPSWQARLRMTAGEALLKIQWRAVPCSVNSTQSSLDHPYGDGGQRMQQQGTEHWVLLPEKGTNAIRAGTYFLAAVSEGQNATNVYRTGTGASSWEMESFGPLAVSNLGVLTGAELGAEDALEGGAAKAYRFTVPLGAPGVEARLENRVGNPHMRLAVSDFLPAIRYLLSPGDSYHFDNYGNFGGVTGGLHGFSLITSANPTQSVHSLVVFASDTNELAQSDIGLRMNAGYALRIRSIPTPELNFTASLNTNGLSNVATGLLVDGQSAFYRVQVPAVADGGPVVGWQLSTTETQGVAYVRARRGLLPDDSSLTMPKGTSSILLTPPFLASGDWYVEVRGSGSTAYTLTSRNLPLERPAWTVPPLGQSSTTPGLELTPCFGDTGVDTNGAPLPGDQGVDLEDGRYHYYVATVPSNQVVLIRTMLEAISGNPDLYLRCGLPPTISHSATGGTGSLVSRQLTGTGTEYGNWVPIDGRYESFLEGGLWYFAVRAGGGAHCRYRLRLSVGDVQEIALHGGSFSNQLLAAKDWRYYRVFMPTNAPAQWHVTFSQQQGDVVMYVRDVSPPGLATNDVDYRHWAQEAYHVSPLGKNDGPYGTYDPPGTYTFGVQPVRPGQTYYLGFCAVNDATFSVSCATSGGEFATPVVLPFAGATNDVSIPGLTSVLFRIDVPANASWLVFSNIHPASVRVYADQGTRPNIPRAHWYSNGASNSWLSWHLLGGKAWPWLPGYSYYLLAKNTSVSSQTFSIRTQGVFYQTGVALALAHGHYTVPLGAPATIACSITNRGPERASNVVVLAAFPPGMTSLAVTSSVGALTANGPGVWSVGAVASGQVVRVELAAQPAAVGLFTVTVAIAGAEADPDLANNASSAVVEVVAAAVPSGAVQRVDFFARGLFNTDVVVNRPPGSDFDRLQGVDGFGSALLTVSAATNLNAGPPHALPDDALFPADSNHAFGVTLGWRNDDYGPNACELTQAGPLPLPVSAGRYDQLDLFAFSANQDLLATVSLQYEDGSVAAVPGIVVDGAWGSDAALAAQPVGVTRYYLIDGLDTCDPGATYLSRVNDPAIHGLRLPVDVGRTLTNVVFTRTSANSGSLFVFGAYLSRRPPDLQVQLSGSPAPAPVGGQVVYQIALSNRTAAAGLTVALTNWLPSALGFLSATSTLGSVAGTNPVVCSLGLLPPGQAATITIVAGAPEVGVFTNEVFVSSFATATSVVHDAASIVTTVVAPLQLLTTNLPAGLLGLPYGAQLSATGGLAGYTWTLDGGSLVAGLTLDADGSLTGIPMAVASTDLAFRVTDSASSSVSRVLNVLILPGNPTDSDHDGMPDWWEAVRGLDPNVSNPAAFNSDADWMPDLEEFIADTDPTNAASFFPAIALTNSPPGTVILVVDPTSPGRVYGVRWTTNLLAMPHAWSLDPAEQTGTESSISFSVTNTAPGRIYRTGVRLP